jgi:hypothetical protein
VVQQARPEDARRISSRENESGQIQNVSVHQRAEEVRNKCMASISAEEKDGVIP